MFIKDGKRFNIYAPYSAEDGTRHTDLRDASLQAKYGITEIPDPVRESEETHFVQEIDEAPYLINTPKPLDEVKKLYRAKVNARRDELERAGFPYLGKLFDSDEKSYYRILGANDAALKSDESFTITWTTADNSEITMSREQTLGLLPALSSYGFTIFAKARELKGQIEMAESLEDILVIDTNFTIE